MIFLFFSSLVRNASSKLKAQGRTTIFAGKMRMSIDSEEGRVFVRLPMVSLQPAASDEINVVVSHSTSSTPSEAHPAQKVENIPI